MTEQTTQNTASEDRHGTQLLQLISDIIQELRPGAPVHAATLDNSLERDLGMDSLARMELLTRIEQHFSIVLSDTRFAAAETPRELLQMIESGGISLPRDTSLIVTAPPPDSTQLPDSNTATLLDVLEWHTARHPDRTHISLYDDNEQLQHISYGELLKNASRIAAGIQQLGLQAGGTVAIMLPTSADYFYSFFGILLAGGVPVPIYPPARLSQIEDHLRRHAKILTNAQAQLLITVPQAQQVARLLKSQVEGLQWIRDASELNAEPAIVQRSAVKATDLAFLQYTSGSTGNPKGVALSHANLLSNIRCMGEAVDAGPEDIFVSWLPLYHDMGLIGAWLGSLYFAMHFVVMSPLTFLARPQRWLRAIHQHRATLSAAPNFAYELCLHKIAESDLQGLNLQSWRHAFNGAEPISPQTIRRFSRQFQPYGFRAEAMTPVYGLAESSVGLAFPPHERLPLIDRVQREPLIRSARALMADETDENALEFPACGQPLPGHQIRIVDDKGRELPERCEGRLQFHGPSCTAGYYRNPQATAELLDGEWLNSGDLAYMVAGDIYLTGRSKDIIIRAGRNIYPHELEQTVGQVPGIRKGCVAAFGSSDASNQTERLIVLAETHATADQALNALRQQVNQAVTDLLGTPADEIVLAPPQTVLKTSSGKIRRSASRERYEQGDINSRGHAVWQQFARLALSSLLPEVRRLRRQATEYLYGSYAWALFLVAAGMVWISTPLIPGLARRWRFIGWASRLLMRLLGIRLQVEGIQHLATNQPGIIVSNHASYLDGALLAAVLTGPVRFVAKGELRSQAVPRIFLQAIGSEFVERFHAQRSIEDSQRLTQLAQQVPPLFFFPEGTFKRMPGLLPFRMGSFVAAAHAAVPVTPICLQGSRSLLREGTWLPRRCPINITITAPIQPAGTDWAAAIKLRDNTRKQMLRNLDEPDLL